MRSSDQGASASCRKKCREQTTAFVRKNATAHLRMVIELFLAEEIDHAARSTGLGVGRTKHDPCDARMHYRAATHHTRLQRDEQCAPGKTIVSDPGRSVTQGHDFGMSGGIMASNRLIETPPHHLAVTHDDGPDGHFITSSGHACLLQRLVHEHLVTRARHIAHVDSLPDADSADGVIGVSPACVPMAQYAEDHLHHPSDKDARDATREKSCGIASLIDPENLSRQTRGGS